MSIDLKPWHKVIDPRADLREHKPLDAAEFAVHLDLVRDENAPPDYQDPRLFFERTYLTRNLTQLAAEVIGRLAKVHGANAVFNLTTQFGGGKTHALTLLYHLATHGPQAAQWFGVERLLKVAGVETVPKAITAVFVGTEFDSLRGRGGTDGTPLRKTPWGEIAYQLRGPEGLKIVAEHERHFIAPAGDVIRELLPQDRPCLILMDELINYMSRNRQYEQYRLTDQLYNFLQSLAEAIRGREQVVLVVSLPKAANEMMPEDESDYQRFVKLLARLSKPIAIASETEVAEIIRRRLFEWDRSALGEDGRMKLSADARAVCAAYASWTVEHRRELSNFPFEAAQQEFEATYPFHPAVISLFQRKWSSLPQFQQTRGILKLLAQWVSEAFAEQYQKAYPDALIGLGTAPLDVLTFRDMVADQQLNETRLKTVITTDICGRANAHAEVLDRQAEEGIRNRRLHRKVATAVLFESNGGQLDGRASLAEVRLAVGEPGLEIAEIEACLEHLLDTCYYLLVQGQRYQFGVRANVNKMLADRAASILTYQVEDRVHEEVQAIFARGPALARVYFPQMKADIPNRAVLTLVVDMPEHPYQDRATLPRIERLTNEHGESYRTFRNALIWCVADSSGTTRLYAEARKLLTLQAIEDDKDADFDETQRRQLADAKLRADRDMKEAVWLSYRYLILLDQSNKLQEIDLGLVHSSAATTIVDLILRELRQAGELVDAIGANYLLRNWPTLVEWSTKAVREIVFTSPKFPRLLNPDSLRNTIAQGVLNGQLAYVGKRGESYEPLYYKTDLRPTEVEFVDDMFLITGETAERYLAAKAEAERKAVEAEVKATVVVHVEEKQEGNGSVMAKQVPVAPPQATSEESGVGGQDETVRKLVWSGEIPALKWMIFYTKVLTRFISDGGVKLLLKMEIAPEKGISRQKLDEMSIALREVGVNEDVHVE
jgi:hypothetical protein